MELVPILYNIYISKIYSGNGRCERAITDKVGYVVMDCRKILMLCVFLLNLEAFYSHFVPSIMLTIGLFMKLFFSLPIINQGKVKLRPEGVSRPKNIFHTLPVVSGVHQTYSSCSTKFHNYPPLSEGSGPSSGAVLLSLLSLQLLYSQILYQLRISFSFCKPRNFLIGNLVKLCFIKFLV